jgi:hypothetical protein
MPSWPSGPRPAHAAPDPSMPDSDIVPESLGRVHCNPLFLLEAASGIADAFGNPAALARGRVGAAEAVTGRPCPE